MTKKTLGIALSAILLAGVFGLSATGAANAQSVMKQCGADWKTAKAAGTTNGQTWQEFLKSCRAQKEAGGAAAAPAPAAAAAPAAAPAPAAAATPEPTPMAATPKKTAPRKSAALATGAGQFTTDAEAKAKCPSDTVVWVNTKSHKYHYAGHRSYGTTKQGAYMCEADATSAGDVAAKGEKPKE